MVVNHIDLDPLALVGVDAAQAVAAADVDQRAARGVRLAAEIGEPLVGEVHDAHDDQRRGGLGERFEDFVREGEEVAAADFARAFEQLAGALERLRLAFRDVGGPPPVVHEEEVVRDGVPLEEQVVVRLEALGVRREPELVRGAVRGGAEQHQPIDDLFVEQVADRQVAAEHVLPENPAIPPEPHSLGIQDDLRIAAEVSDDVAAAGRDLLEEKPAIDVRSGDDREVLDVLPDEALVDDGSDRHGDDSRRVGEGGGGGV